MDIQYHFLKRELKVSSQNYLDTMSSSIERFRVVREIVTGDG